MELGALIKHLYPSAVSQKDYAVKNDGDGAYIAEWYLNEPQPTQEELEAEWAKYTPEPRPLTRLEEVERQQTELVFELMMKGVL
jgi:hypothetical protein